MRLTREKISELLRKPLYEIGHDELNAVLFLIGFTAKDFLLWTDSRGIKRVRFEIHHRYLFVVAVETDSSCSVAFYDNIYVFKEGMAVPTPNLTMLIQMLMNLFVKTMKGGYDGPLYIERADGEYGTEEEMAEMLEVFKEEHSKAVDELPE